MNDKIMVHDAKSVVPTERFTALIARLEAAETGSRELHAAFARVIAGSPTDHWYALFGEWVTDDTVPAYTSSLDAALALAERVCPAMMWSAHPACPGVTMGYHVPRSFGNGEQWATAPTPALALCIAILKAKREADSLSASSVGTEPSGGVNQTNPATEEG